MKNGIITIFAITSIFIFQGSFSKPSKYEGKIVKKIDFQGLKNIKSQSLQEIMRTTVGYPLKAHEVRKDIKEVFKKGNFKKVLVEIEEFKNGVRLKFNCEERPFVKEIEFKGTDEIPDSDLLTEVLVKEGEVYRKDYLKKSIEIIKEKYNTEGFFNAHISYEVIALDDEGSQVKVAFIVDEGEEIRVEKITLLGAKKVYPKILTSVMETEESTLFKDGSFQEDIFEEDKAKIIAYYKEQGYLDAEIIDVKKEYEWVNPKKKEKRGIFLTIKLSEGDRYYFDSYSIKINEKDGETVFKPEDFIEEFQLTKRGVHFNNTMFMMDRQNISFKYASKGYIFARVIPKRTIIERKVEEDGKMIVRKFVKIDFVVDEGSQAYIDTIIVKGNKKTKDKVIRREVLMKEGDLFDARKMQLTREKIYNLGFFKEVNIDVRPGSREGYMNLIVDVEEQPTGTISLGGGYGTTSGFSIFADVGESNLLGNGQKIGVKFEYGPLRTSVTLTFQERWLFNVPLGLSASIFYNYYTNQTAQMFTTQQGNAEYKKQAFGYALGLSYRFFYHYIAGISWSHAFKSIIDPTGNSPDAIFMEQSHGIQEKRTLSLYMFRDSKDNYLNPTWGGRVGLNVGFTGGIFGGADHYVEYSPEISWYFSHPKVHLPFLKKHKLVIELRANATFLSRPLGNVSQNYTTNQWLELEDRLYIGGPETIRGWDYNDSRFPRSWQYVGLHHMILFGAELRIPLHPRMLWMAIFFDGGALFVDSFWKNHLYEDYHDLVQEDLDSGDLAKLDDFFNTYLPTYFRYSWGFGFRIQIPMLPLRFWFGQKLIPQGRKLVASKDLTFQFQIGDRRF